MPTRSAPSNDTFPCCNENVRFSFKAAFCSLAADYDGVGIIIVPADKKFIDCVLCLPKRLETSNDWIARESLSSGSCCCNQTSLVSSAWVSYSFETHFATTLQPPSRRALCSKRHRMFPVRNVRTASTHSWLRVPARTACWSGIKADFKSRHLVLKRSSHTSPLMDFSPTTMSYVYDDTIRTLSTALCRFFSEQSGFSALSHQRLLFPVACTGVSVYTFFARL